MNNEVTECWRLLFNLVDELREEAARRNRNMEISEFANVTVGQMRILKAIFAFQEKYPDGVMLKLLAEKVNLTPGAASIIVDTLVKQGFWTAGPAMWTGVQSASGFPRKASGSLPVTAISSRE